MFALGQIDLREESSKKSFYVTHVKSVPQTDTGDQVE